MSKARKPQQLKLDLRKRGGKRKGAGRPSVSGGRRHEKRPHITGREPLHVTIKLKEGRPSLKQKIVWKVFKRAVERARLKGLRLAHFALLSNHAHLILEAQDNDTLAQGLKSFLITLAKALNKLASLKGSVLKDRYHLHVLTTPTEVRRALSYVCANEAKHRQSHEIRLDAFASTALLRENIVGSSLLKAYVVQAMTSSQLEALLTLLKEICATPRTWLLSKGWKIERSRIP